jgi:sugar-specific transcriptional regulator TrmB
MKDFLISLGFDNKEAEVYTHILRIGTSPVSLLSQKIKMPRSTVQYTCEKLEKKGIISSLKKDKSTYYYAESPEKILQECELQEKKSRKKTEIARMFYEQAQTLYENANNIPKIQVFEGKNGIKTLLESLLVEPSHLLSFGAGDYFLKHCPNLVESFREKAYKTYKSIKVIRAPIYKHKHKKKEHNIHTKFFPFLQEQKVDIQITDNIMTIASIDKNHPIGIRIEHKEIIESFRNIFEEMWKLIPDEE